MYDNLLKSHSKFKVGDIVYFPTYDLKVGKAKIISISFIVTEIIILPQYKLQRLDKNVICDLEYENYLDDGNNIYSSFEEMKRETIKNMFKGEE
jgi:hypothetical protein